MANCVPRRVRVYLLDDHDVVRRGVRDLLVAAPDIHVVGESGPHATPPERFWNVRST